MMKKWLVFLVFLMATCAMGAYSYFNLFEGLPSFQLGGETRVAEVIELLPEKESDKLRFKAKVLYGDNKGEVVEALQNRGDAFILAKMQEAVTLNEKIILERVPSYELGGFINQEGAFDEARFDSLILWRFLDYYRLSPLFVLGLFFALGLVFLGQKKGLMTLVSLVLTILAVFFFFIPWVLAEKSVYFGLFLTLAYLVPMSLFLISGFSKKTFVTITSTFIGLFFAFLVSYFSKEALHMTGYFNEESIYLANLNEGSTLDLIALSFSAILIGALGAVMDMAMDIASSLYELSQKANLSQKSLIKSGLKIGTDVLGTMSNTLILAYIGSGLMGFMLLLTYSHSLSHLLSREVIALELLQALAGSLALVLMVPVTVILSSVVYVKKKDA